MNHHTELSQYTEKLSALRKYSDNIHCVTLCGQIKEATQFKKARYCLPCEQCFKQV